MTLSSKINVNYVRVRHAGGQTQEGCPDGIIQVCGDWPRNTKVWTVSGDHNECRAFVTFLSSKGIITTRVELTKKKDSLTRLFSKAEKIRDLSDTEHLDTVAGRAELNKAICSAIAMIMAPQLATERRVIFEHLEASSDIPDVLDTFLCRAQQQQLRQWQENIMLSQGDNKGAEAYLRSAPFPRFDGKYDSDTRNRMGGIAGAEPTITSTDNTEEQHEE